MEDTLAFSRRNATDSDNDPDNPSQTMSADSREKYSSFIPKSHWPYPRQGHDLETFVNSVESDIVPLKPPKSRHDNYTKIERSLNRKSDIVIKPADKDPLSLSWIEITMS